MKRGYTLLAVLAYALPLFAQSSNIAKTGGSCSPAITGSSNQIVINCNGLSAAKASQLVVLMNRILTERLDVSEVNSKLDQLHSDIGGLSAAINPLANAPAPVLAILKRSDVLVAQCTNFLADWSERSVSAMQAAGRASVEASEADMAAWRATNESIRNASREVDVAKAQEFARIYTPRLEALNSSLHRLMPDAPAINAPSSSATATQASQYAFQVFLLSQRYKQQQGQQGRASDLRLLNEASNVFQDANMFCRSWQEADLAALHAARTSPHPPEHDLNATIDAQMPVDSEEKDKYLSTLEPQLVAFRDAVQPKVPEFSSGRDYTDVKTVTQLRNICLDVQNLASAYKQRVIEEQQSHDGNSTKAR